MNKQLFQRTLHELAAQAVPSNLDLWPAIRERLGHRSHRTLRARLIPSTRLGWLSLVLAALCIFSMTAYATAPGIRRLLQMDERLKHADPARLGQPLDLSQTIDNVTITVQWAYADADRVLVGATMRTSDGRRFEPYGDTLTDATGIAFPWQEGYGDGEGTFVRIFDNAYKHAATPRALNMHFIVYAQELAFPPGPSVLSTTEAGVAQVQLQPISGGTRTGPFAFDFSVPVISSAE